MIGPKEEIIKNYIQEKQPKYLETMDPEDLAPLTRKEISENTGISLSTLDHYLYEKKSEIETKKGPNIPCKKLLKRPEGGTKETERKIQRFKDYLQERQSEYLETMDPEDLAPLTRKEISESAGIPLGAVDYYLHCRDIVIKTENGQEIPCRDLLQRPERETKETERKIQRFKDYLQKKQSKYMKTLNPEDIVPLTRKEISENTGINPDTVDYYLRRKNLVIKTENGQEISCRELSKRSYAIYRKNGVTNWEDTCEGYIKEIEACLNDMELTHIVHVDPRNQRHSAPKGAKLKRTRTRQMEERRQRVKEYIEEIQSKYMETLNLEDLVPITCSHLGNKFGLSPATILTYVNDMEIETSEGSSVPARSLMQRKFTNNYHPLDRTEP